MNNKPTLIIMCGVPGAGKDYQIMNHKFFENLRANVVSRDTIRFNMLQDFEKQTSDTMRTVRQKGARFKTGLGEGLGASLGQPH